MGEKPKEKRKNFATKSAKGTKKIFSPAAGRE
jgi:hypothetical protein